MSTPGVASITATTPSHEGGFFDRSQGYKRHGPSRVNVRFGPTFAEGAHGGTGIWLYKNWLYAEIDDKIVRYELKSGEVAPTGKPETIVSGMPINGDHPMRPFAIDSQGNLFVSMGSVTNACEEQNRMPHSPGRNPCTELDTNAGIWRYDANKTGPGILAQGTVRHWHTQRRGLRLRLHRGACSSPNMAATSCMRTGPNFIRRSKVSSLPAEEVVMLKEGVNYGWPTCYYDDAQKKLVLAPEYGGDAARRSAIAINSIRRSRLFRPTGRQTISRSTKARSFRRATKEAPSSPSTAHGTERPAPQGGYNVVFQPLSDGKPSGDYIVFADGFAGAATRTQAGPRIARLGGGGPDGTLYITDDKAGRIWRVTYVGDPNAKGIEAAPTLRRSKPKRRRGSAARRHSPRCGRSQLTPGTARRHERTGRARQEDLSWRGCWCDVRRMSRS